MKNRNNFGNTQKNRRVFYKIQSTSLTFSVSFCFQWLEMISINTKKLIWSADNNISKILRIWLLQYDRQYKLNKNKLKKFWREGLITWSITDPNEWRDTTCKVAGFVCVQLRSCVGLFMTFSVYFWLSNKFCGHWLLSLSERMMIKLLAQFSRYYYDGRCNSDGYWRLLR